MAPRMSKHVNCALSILVIIFSSGRICVQLPRFCDISPPNRRSETGAAKSQAGLFDGVITEEGNVWRYAAEFYSPGCLSPVEQGAHSSQILRRHAACNSMPTV